MLDIGFKNFIRSESIINIIPPKSAKAKWLVKEAIANKRVINCTHGGKTKSLIILNSRHIILSTLKCSSIKKRFEEYKNDREKNINNAENEAIADNAETQKENISIKENN